MIATYFRKDRCLPSVQQPGMYESNMHQILKFAKIVLRLHMYSDQE